MAQITMYRIRRTPWKVAVRGRLALVEEDVKRAISAKGWSLNEPGQTPRISPAANEQRTPEMDEAEAVVMTIFNRIHEARECMLPPRRWSRRLREWVAGELLMSTFESLHLAESDRVKLLSSEQLAAILPTIRQRAATYLAANDPRLAALQGIPDYTSATHQALAHLQGALIQSVTAVHAGLHAQTATPTAGPPHDAAPGGGAAHGAPPGAPVQAAPAGGAPPGSPPPPPGAPVQAAAAGGAPPGSPPQVPSGAGSNAPVAKLTEMLGRDQLIAAIALSKACQTEDLQQSQVRRFRNVLLGTFGGLLVLAVLVAILGGLHPKYFPLCLTDSAKQTATSQSTAAKQTTTMPVVCPTGGNSPSGADVPLIMLTGVAGASLAVARNLTGLTPTGVRYSLSVAQGLVKLAFGAITGVLGIIVLSTQTSIGFLGSQAGLLTTAVVFGYSQQLFTKLIDQQANDLTNKAAGPSAVAG
jgi:hypothetical protein